MITTTKKPELNEQPELHTVYFLDKDGFEKEEIPTIHDRAYVSQTDHDKYGKVEVYRLEDKLYRNCFLKQFRGGRAGELLVDPYGMFAKPEDLSAYVNTKGHRFCEYTPVSEVIYESYVNYLRTRDVRYFRFAEKAVLDIVK